MAHQTNPVTFALIVRIPSEGIADFRAYEDAVLPLLPEFSDASSAGFEIRKAPSRSTSSAWHPMRTFKIIEMIPDARRKPGCSKDHRRSWN